jgi:hypothetical protein
MSGEIIGEMLRRTDGIKVTIQKYSYGRLDELELEAGDIAKTILRFIPEKCEDPFCLSDFDSAEAGIEPVYPVNFAKCIGVFHGKHIVVVGRYVPCHYQRNPEPMLEFTIRVVDNCWQLRKSLKI